MSRVILWLKTMLGLKIVLAALSCAVGGQAAWADEPIAGIDAFRDRLARAGYQFNMTYIAEGLANVSGGMRTGAIYTGRLDLGATIDLEKVMGWNLSLIHI